jgi:hypothetical protein
VTSLTTGFSSTWTMIALPPSSSRASMERFESRPRSQIRLKSSRMSCSSYGSPTFDIIT